MRSLTWKLCCAFFLVVAISVGLTAYFINVDTTQKFSQYLSREDQRYVQNMSNVLGQIYARDENWDSAQTVLSELLRSDNERLALADSANIIVGDTANQWLENTEQDIGLSDGTPVIVSGEEVGELYLFSTQPGNSGAAGNPRGKGKNALPASSLISGEQDFLDQVNHSMAVTGLIAAAIALIIGLILTHQITRPIKALTKGARQIANGNFNHTVKVRSKDEIGDLSQSFNAMAANLNKAEQERQRIIADIAHELRTPLTVINGTVDGIQDGVFKPDKERLASIKEQTALLTLLVSDLRDLSLAESGQLKLALAPTDLIDLVKRKAAQFEMRAREKDIELRLNLPEEAPEIDIDPARIEQVLANLMTNAIRHTPAQGNITISMRIVDGDEGHRANRPSLMISVADTGEGIAPEHLPHIFERFYRAETSRARSEGGAGLGLAIVKQMIHAHGGKVWAESKAGKGSTFYVVL